MKQRLRHVSVLAPGLPLPDTHDHPSQMPILSVRSMTSIATTATNVPHGVDEEDPEDLRLDSFDEMCGADLVVVNHLALLNQNRIGNGNSNSSITNTNVSINTNQNDEYRSSMSSNDTNGRGHTTIHYDRSLLKQKHRKRKQKHKQIEDNYQLIVRKI